MKKYIKMIRSIISKRDKYTIAAMKTILRDGWSGALLKCNLLIHKYSFELNYYNTDSNKQQYIKYKQDFIENVKDVIEKWNGRNK